MQNAATMEVDDDDEEQPQRELPTADGFAKVKMIFIKFIYISKLC